jgi:hypothetical protein
MYSYNEPVLNTEQEPLEIVDTLASHGLSIAGVPPRRVGKSLW